MATIEEALAAARSRHRAGDLSQAESICRRIVQAQPDNVDAWCVLAATVQAAGQPGHAAACYRRALAIRPDDASLWLALGNSLYLHRDCKEAAAAYRRLLELRPEHADAWNNLGASLADQGRHEEAVACYERARAARPGFADAYYNLGNSLRERGRLLDAVAAYREALAAGPARAEVHNNLALAFYRLRQFAHAEESCRRALRLRPHFAEAHNNLGLALMEQGRLEEALDCYGEALRIAPQNPEWHRNRSLALLLNGDFEPGWQEYEFRRQCHDFTPVSIPRPQWDGEALDGRRILLHCEQGAGDTFQFVRYAPLVQRRGGVVIVAAPPALMPILRSCPGVDELVALGTVTAPFDVHAPLLSLPRIFNTSLATIPGEVPYLAPDPELCDAWRREIGGLAGFKVGVAWQGNPAIFYDCARSFALQQLAPLAAVESVRLVSLQSGFGTEQVADGFPLIDLGPGLDRAGAFTDTAALMKSLDLVVTADTAVAHLAGALGVSAWVALPAISDWRWLRGRDDSPWYPTLRLFRQTRAGAWDDVFARMAQALRDLVSTREPLQRR
jgi:tetratricopeptide (TPR) repeat protein